MIRSKRINSSGMFLTELILALLFFALASAVCLQLFAKARSMTQDSVQLSRAAAECSSAAELIGSLDSADDLYALFTSVYPCAEFNGYSVCTGFDESFSPCPAENASYIMNAACKCDDDGISADIAFSCEGKEIYSLSVFRHFQRRAET